MRLIFTVVFSLCLATLMSQEVSRSEALEVAERFMLSRPGNPYYQGFSVDNIRAERGAKGQIQWYVINLNPSGWMVLAAREEAFPVVAYSFNGRHTGEGLPGQYVAWMDQHARALDWLAEQPLGSVKPNRAWKGDFSFVDDSKELTPVEPFVFSSWDQGWPYNEKCPKDGASSDGRCPTGCVPTAMAQIMHYYRWPETGTGSYTYDAGTYGILSADFGSTSYNWNSMGTSLIHSSPSAATLLSQLGISCDLVYGPNGSGMYNHKAAYSLRTYFKYSPETRYVFRDSTSMQWDSLLISHLNRRMPLYYAGWSLPNVNGHAFVCDGYHDTAFFHFNFGWSGSYDGFYNINSLLVGGNNFNLAQEVIVNCYPDTIHYSYPPAQPSSNVLSLFEGSGSDGSAPEATYTPGTSCNWLLDLQSEQDSVESVSIVFHRLDLGSEQDVITVFNGPDDQSPVLAAFSAGSQPSVVTATSGKVYISFVAEGANPGKGFLFSYQSQLPVWCSGTKTFTTPEGQLSDGSYGFQYYNKSRCIYKIQPAGVGSVTLFIDAFETEPTVDYLRILSLGTNEVLGEISGNIHPDSLPGPFTSNSGKMMLLFSTNDSVRGNGFKAHWAANVGIDQPAGLLPLQLWPNPCREQLTVYAGANRGSARLTITNLTGQVVLLQVAELSADGCLRVDVSDLNAGWYQAELETQGLHQRGKFVRLQ